MSRPLPRYTDQRIEHDPLEILLAQREAETTRARAAIAAGHAGQQADPADLRGIPVQAMGVGGTSPGTAPENALLAQERRSQRHATIAA